MTNIYPLNLSDNSILERRNGRNGTSTNIFYRDILPICTNFSLDRLASGWVEELLEELFIKGKR
jgi:hypothetical protein